MSTLSAVVKKIQNVDSLHLVSFDFCGQDLSMLSLELSNDVIVGKNVYLNIKSSSVALAKEYSGELSYANKIDAKIKKLTNGNLVSNVTLEVNDDIFEALITKEASIAMKLQEGEVVTALLKASEISIAEVLN